MRDRSVEALAGWLYWVISAVMLVLPLMTLVVILGEARPEFAPPTMVSEGELLAFWGVDAVMVAAGLLILWQMRALMDCYRRGEVLTDRAAGHIRRVGQGLGLLALLRLISPTVLTLIASHDNPPGEKLLSITIDSDTVGLALAGCLLILIGWAMGRAVVIAKENAGFV